jgi:hypothetical protein
MGQGIHRRLLSFFISRNIEIMRQKKLFPVHLCGATLLGKKLHDLFDLLVLDKAPQNCALPRLPDKADPPEMVDVVGEGGVGRPEFFLDLTHRHARFTGANEFAHNLETRLVAELAEQRGRGIVCQCHVGNIGKVMRHVNHISRNIEIFT